MSLIMEAIKKAQQIRWAGNQNTSWPPGIREERQSLGKKPKRWWLLLLLLLLGGGVLTFWSKHFYHSSPGIQKSSDKIAANKIKEEVPASISSPKKEGRSPDRPLLPLTVVTMTEPGRRPEMEVKKTSLKPRGEEKPEPEDLLPQKEKVLAKKEEEEQQRESAKMEEEEKLKTASGQEKPPSEIKVEKLTGEIEAAQEAIKNFNAGVNYYQKRNLGQALQAYKKALQHDARFLEAYNNLALIYQEMGDLDQARETLQKAIEINAHYEKAWNNLGIILLLQNRYREAKEVFEKLLLLNPHHAESYRSALSQRRRT